MAVTEDAFRAAILPLTLHFEGGFSGDAHDAGNWTGGAVGKGVLKGTKYGIAASAHPTLDIRHLTITEASGLYWTSYCVRPGFDRLSLPLLQVAFDAGVNCGPARARAWLALSASQATERQQIAAFSAHNLAYHRSLKTWPRYGRGWASRIQACEAHALALLVTAPAPATARVALPHADTSRPTPRAADQPAASSLALLIRSLVGLLTADPQLQGA